MPIRQMMHVAALSGGADSTAMALRLAEVEPREYVYLCTPTGDEPEALFAHWRHLGELLGTPITPLMVSSLDGLIAEYNALPNWRQRWCTRRLKIEPFAAWLATRTPATLYVGLRADEEEREGGNYAKVGGVEMRYPLREWGWARPDVMRYLAKRGIEIPKRTDCELCFFQTLGQWFDLWRENPEKYAQGEAYEAQTGYTFRSPGRDQWPAALKDLRAEFERGNIPRDRKQLSLFETAQCRVCSL